MIVIGSVDPDDHDDHDDLVRRDSARRKTGAKPSPCIGKATDRATVESAEPVARASEDADLGASEAPGSGGDAPAG